MLVVIAIYSPSATFGIPNRSNSPGTTCKPTGGQSTNGLELVECCWAEDVPPGTGPYGTDWELYCSECENGGTRGMINCSDPELQFTPVRGEDITGFPEGGVVDEPPTPSPTSPFRPPQGGVLQQPQNDQPPLFGRNVPLQGFGVFGQQPAAIVPPSPVLTPVPPVLTPEPPVPMFGQIAPQGQVPLTEGGVAEQPIRCPVGNVWDPNIMICVPDLPPLTPPQLCPDGSIPQSTGPGGIRPECPSFKAEQPEIQEPDEPEDDEQEEGAETAGPLT